MAQKKRQAKAEAKLLNQAAQRHSEMLNPCMLSVLLHCTIFFSLVPCFTIFPACVINVTLCVCRACVYLSARSDSHLVCLVRLYIVRHINSSLSACPPLIRFPASLTATTHTQSQVVRMRMEWAKEKADRGCEKLAHYLKTRDMDGNMLLNASKRNRGHCTGNAVEDTIMADEPARVLPPHAIPKWCELHSRRYYKNKKDAHACDTFLTPPYMDKLASLSIGCVCVRVCGCLFLVAAHNFIFPPVTTHISLLCVFLRVRGLARTDYLGDVMQEGWQSCISVVLTR